MEISEENTAAFKAWPKTPRLNNAYVTVTEKLDGTNAQLFRSNDGTILAGSRNRWLTPESDNYGFAAWVEANKVALLDLLPVGRYYGEWWGLGIQRGYAQVQKRLSLFAGATLPDSTLIDRVPVLYTGRFDASAIESAIEKLRLWGSLAAPGNAAEGAIVEIGCSRYKVLFET